MLTDDSLVTLRRLLVESVPRALALLDKNPYSKTFGCFDRKFWHYKIIDFPSGMQQELVLPLAYVWSTAFEGNPYFRCNRLAQFIKGAFRYHGCMSHADGSLDDYFPDERAFGATAYALVALTEAALRTGLHSDQDTAGFEKSGEFIATYREAGKLSNHLAIGIAALHNLYRLTGAERWKVSAERLADRLLAEQNEEGWFPEYEGCDLGYQTVTIEFLARAVQNGFEHQSLPSALDSAVAFLRQFVHPDGSLGGEYGSRNTYNFYPGGFAIMASRSMPAREILASFFKGLKTGSANHLDDDGVFQHLLSSYVTALSCPLPAMTEWEVADVFPPQLRLFPVAQLYTIRSRRLSVFGALSKGGVFKVFEGARLIASDTGFMARLADGRTYCQNKANNASWSCDSGRIVISGHLKPYRSKTLSRIEMAGLRCLSILFGRFSVFSHAIRRLMQRVLIYDTEKTAIAFVRTLTVSDGSLHVRDDLTNNFPLPMASLDRTTDCTNMHVITSNSFQSANLLDWESVPVSTDRAVYTVEKRYGSRAG